MCPEGSLGNIPSVIAHGTSADSNPCASVLSSRYIRFQKNIKNKKSEVCLEVNLNLKLSHRIAIF